MFPVLLAHIGYAQKEAYRTFIPKGYSLLDTTTGDLNRDAYPDMVLILKIEHEQDSMDVSRPLLLLAGTPQKTYQLIGRNDSVVLCRTCGGIFGDPYQATVIKNGYFSIEHYGGSNWRWTRVITFKYDPASKQFKLHRDAGTSFHTSNPQKEEKQVHQPERFGKMTFSEYVVD